MYHPRKDRWDGTLIKLVYSHVLRIYVTYKYIIFIPFLHLFPISLHSFLYKMVIVLLRWRASGINNNKYTSYFYWQVEYSSWIHSHNLLNTYLSIHILYCFSLSRSFSRTLSLAYTKKRSPVRPMGINDCIAVVYDLSQIAYNEGYRILLWSWFLIWWYNMVLHSFDCKKFEKKLPETNIFKYCIFFTQNIHINTSYIRWEKKKFSFLVEYERKPFLCEFCFFFHLTDGTRYFLFSFCVI